MYGNVLKTLIIISFLFCAHEACAQEWNEYKGRHFIIYYKNAPKRFVNTVEESAEKYYQEIARNLGFTRYEGWNWEDRARVYIYDNAEDYIRSAKGANWSHGYTSPKNKVIRTFPSAHGFFDSTLPHELGHIIFREFIGFKAKVPLWLEEGVAMYQEKAQRWGADQAVREAMDKGTFIPLEKLTKMRLTHKTDKGTVNLFYAESASIVNYMIDELGQHRFVRFCRQLQDGGPFEWTLEKIYVRFPNVEKLNKAWTDYLKK